MGLKSLGFLRVKIVRTQIVNKIKGLPYIIMYTYLTPLTPTQTIHQFLLIIPQSYRGCKRIQNHTLMNESYSLNEIQPSNRIQPPNEYHSLNEVHSVDEPDSVNMVQRITIGKGFRGSYSINGIQSINMIQPYTKVYIQAPVGSTRLSPIVIYNYRG